MVSSSKKSANLRLKSGRNLCTSPGPGKGLKKQQHDAGSVACACNSSAQQAEAGELSIRGSSETLFKPLPKNNIKNHPNPNHAKPRSGQCGWWWWGQRINSCLLMFKQPEKIYLSIWFLYAFNMAVARRVKKPAGKKQTTSNVRAQLLLTSEFRDSLTSPRSQMIFTSVNPKIFPTGSQVL